MWDFDSVREMVRNVGRSYVIEAVSGYTLVNPESLTYFPGSTAQTLRGSVEVSAQAMEPAMA